MKTITNIAKIIPKNPPVINSLIIIGKGFLSLNSSVLKPRIITVDDCAPTFPPASINHGVKKAKVTTSSKTSSQLLLKKTVTELVTNKISNQGIHFLVTL